MYLGEQCDGVLMSSCFSLIQLVAMVLGFQKSGIGARAGHQTFLSASPCSGVGRLSYAIRQTLHLHVGAWLDLQLPMSMSTNNMSKHTHKMCNESASKAL